MNNRKRVRTGRVLTVQFVVIALASPVLGQTRPAATPDHEPAGVVGVAFDGVPPLPLDFLLLRPLAIARSYRRVWDVCGARRSGRTALSVRKPTGSSGPPGR